jgi:hypothetical protein
VAQKVATELQDVEAGRQRLKAAYRRLAKPTNKEKRTLLAEVKRVIRREAQLAVCRLPGLPLGCSNEVLHSTSLYTAQQSTTLPTAAAAQCCTALRRCTQ